MLSDWELEALILAESSRLWVHHKGVPGLPTHVVESAKIKAQAMAVAMHLTPRLGVGCSTFELSPQSCIVFAPR